MGVAFQPFRPVGAYEGLIPFVTESWTGETDKETGQVAEYEVEFDVREKTVRCSCMDSVCRMKNRKPIGSKNVCKHSRLAVEILWPIIDNALSGGTRREIVATSGTPWEAK